MNISLFFTLAPYLKGVALLLGAPLAWWLASLDRALIFALVFLALLGVIMLAQAKKASDLKSPPNFMAKKVRSVFIALPFYAAAVCTTLLAGWFGYLSIQESFSRDAGMLTVLFLFVCLFSVARATAEWCWGEDACSPYYRDFKGEQRTKP